MKPTIAFTTDKTSWHELWKKLEPTIPQPGIRLFDVHGKSQPFVQWQIGMLDNDRIVNLYNSSHDAQIVRISNASVDVLTGVSADAGQAMKLEPMDVRLLRCAGK